MNQSYARVQKQFEALKTLAGKNVTLQLAEAIAKAAKENAPVDTGKLRDSIEVKSDGEVRIEVGVEYGVAVEYGTYKMAAQPYLRPAIDSAKVEDAKDTLEKEIKESLR
jgi:HK97 gp10 family phage protein